MPITKIFRPALAWLTRPRRNISFRAGYGIFYAPTSNNTFNNQGTEGNPFFFDFVQTGDVRTPISVASGFPGGGINNVLASPSFRAYYGPLNRPDPYSEKYNANLQWSFSKDWLLDLGYVGQRSLHFPRLNRAIRSLSRARARSFNGSRIRISAPFISMYRTRRVITTA